MKKIVSILVPAISFLVILFNSSVSFAQQSDETEIRTLEKMEGEAWVKHDTATLLTLFSSQFVVNTPLNRVATFEEVMHLVRIGKIDVSAVEKFIEKITFVENIAIVMGHDTIKPERGMVNAGKTVNRRYTDIWMKDKTSWKLTARQATIVSAE